MGPPQSQLMPAQNQDIKIIKHLAPFSPELINPYIHEGHPSQAKAATKSFVDFLSTPIPVLSNGSTPQLIHGFINILALQPALPG
jgi:hypothetical protein